MSINPYSTEFAIGSVINGVAVRIALLQMPHSTHPACIGVNSVVLFAPQPPFSALKFWADLASALLQSILSRVSCDGFYVSEVWLVQLRLAPG